MFDDAKYDEVISHVRALASDGGALEVREHFASYFDELGLWVKFAEGAPDQQVISVGNQLLAYLNSELPRDNSLFSWALSLERGRNTVDVLSPGDGARDLNGSLTALK